jgi:hypothetical protein
MATLLPESVMRLQATALVNDVELSNLGRCEIIRQAAQTMAESALRKLLTDCIQTKQYLGFQGSTLCLDVCVIEPGELLRLLADARAEGERDALRWRSIPKESF